MGRRLYAWDIRSIRHRHIDRNCNSRFPVPASHLRRDIAGQANAGEVSLHGGDPCGDCKADPVNFSVVLEFAKVGYFSYDRLTGWNVTDARRGDVGFGELCVEAGGLASGNCFVVGGFRFGFLLDQAGYDA